MISQEMVEAVILERQAELAALLQVQEAERLVRADPQARSAHPRRARRRSFSLAGWLAARTRALIQARA